MSISLSDFVTELTELFARAGLDEPRREVRLFLREIAGLEPEIQFAKAKMRISEQQALSWRELAQRRALREPLAYLAGAAWFYGRSFRIMPGLLVPRRDSEVLIEAALAELPAPRGQQGLKILDTCCGCGCLGLTLLAELGERSDATLHLLDSSGIAVQTAEQNAAALSLQDRCTFEQGDIWPACAFAANNKFDLIICNPPYIATADIADLMPEVKDFESHAALDGGEDGLAFYRRIAEEYRHYLKPEGLMVLELGAGQAEAVAELFAAEMDRLAFYPDYGGHLRALVLRGKHRRAKNA
jgi:release factor glutamine methyltransferase